MLDWTEDHAEYKRFSQLFLLAYIFLLRVPSEALAATFGRDLCHTHQTVLWLEDSKLHINLRRRKNRPGGSRLTRKCWCQHSRKTCPVHVFGKLVEEVPAGTALFEGIDANRSFWRCLFMSDLVASIKALACRATAALRTMLAEVGTKAAEQYRLHDIRRGHAKDLQLSGECVALSIRQLLLCSCRANRCAALDDFESWRMDQPRLFVLHGLI